VIIALVGVPLLAVLGWRGTSVLLGLLAAVIAVAILVLIRERGTDRAAAIAGGNVRHALRRVVGDRDLRWLYLTSVLGGGGRGLGVVNLFALIYLSEVLALPETVYAPMYAALIVFSVPMPLLAGWLSDRLGRKPLIIGAYVGGAIGFVVFLLAGSNIAGLWAGIILMGLFAFAESPQLQALLSDIAPPAIRDASYSLYFTLAFGVGSLWVALYGFVIERLGAATGVPLAFLLMAGAFGLAALGTVPIRADERAAANAEFEAGLPGA
jgi:MFS transporter, DHA1 family, inner membrane transport protein